MVSLDSRKARPSQDGNAEGDDADEVIPAYQRNSDDWTVSERRRVDGVSVGTVNRLGSILGEIQDTVEAVYGEHITTRETLALPGLAFAGSQRHSEGTVPALERLQNSGVNQPDRSESLYYETSPKGRYYIEHTPTGSASKKSWRSGSRNIGLAQTMRLGLKALVRGEITIEACAAAYGTFHSRFQSPPGSL